MRKISTSIADRLHQEFIAAVCDRTTGGEILAPDLPHPRAGAFWFTDEGELQRCEVRLYPWGGTLVAAIVTWVREQTDPLRGPLELACIRSSAAFGELRVAERWAAIQIGSMGMFGGGDHRGVPDLRKTIIEG